MKNKTLAILAITLLSALAAKAQVAQGGTYKLDQTVIASGGGTSADATGGTYTLDGAIGEPIAGTSSTASTFKITGGFFTTQLFAPTAASASFGGRIETFDGSGLRNALVILTDAGGNQQSIISGINGSFRFDNLRAGEVYIVSIASKLFVFPTQVVFIGEDLSDIVIKATGQNGIELSPLIKVKGN